ncbi:MAG: sodium:alanine symporter family protein [Lachnospiraceae bacterium]|nr:sodium:alanine symporter family protein [Lachnospiraceae bacterium]
MSCFYNFLQTANSFLWNGPLLLFLLFTHLYFTTKTGFVQRKLPTALRLSVSPQTDAKPHQKQKGLGAFASLATTLAATLGTGNIIGLSTAVAFGGPGAVFWCWITGLLGMATSYTECFLSLKFRKTRSDGSFCGGPMYLLRNQLHRPKTAQFYAYLLLASAFCVGCSTQSRAVTETLHTLFDLPEFPTGVCLALVITVVLLGGITGIGTVCSLLVPVMGGFFLLSCSILLFLLKNHIADALALILSSAFSFSSVSGGLLGSSFLLTARQGIARGLFTNEAGLGSAPVAAANSNGNPKEQALVLMSATFWDTVVMCGVTGIVIVCAGLAVPGLFDGYAPGDYTLAAFTLLPFAGDKLLGIAIVLFAVATLLGWCFFGEKAVEFLFSADHITYYRFVYCLMVFFGSQMTMNLVWELSDLFNGLMFVTNMICLFMLRKKIERPE